MASDERTDKVGDDAPTSGFPSHNIGQSQDVLWVRGRFQEEVKTLAKELEQELGYTTDQSIHTAENILLRGKGVRR